MGPAKYIPVFCLYSVFEDECAEMPDGELDIKLTETTKRMIKEHFPRADSVAIICNPEMFLFDIEKTFNQDIKHELVHYFHIYNGLLTPDGERAMDMEYMMYLTQDVPARPTIRGPQYIFSADYVYRILFCKDVFSPTNENIELFCQRKPLLKEK